MQKINRKLKKQGNALDYLLDQQYAKKKETD